MGNTDQRVPDISVVIITRNESANIASCIESILTSAADDSPDIILVDSASTDATVDIARRYPITIVHLESSPLLSPAVGRFIGTRYARAPLIQFLDGDMVVFPGWVHAAQEVFQDPLVGGVAGLLHRSRPTATGETILKDTSAGSEVECFGGAAVYRKAVLDQVGTFNPFMLGEEERELGYRIRRMGYVLKRIPVEMAVHVEKVQDHGEVSEKSRFFRGVGQLVRGYPFQPICWRILGLQSGELLRQMIFWGTPVVLVVAALTGWSLFAILGTVLVALGLLALLAWKGPRKVLLYAKRRVLIPSNILQGLFIGIGRPADFRIGATVEKSERSKVT